jgi:hypothetical protein
MADAVNIEQMIVARAWALLEASAKFTTIVKEGNRIRLDAEGKKYPLKTTWNDSDFPEVTVAYPIITHSMFTIERTYAMGQASYNPALSPEAVDLDCVVNIEVVHQFQNIVAMGQLNAEILKALFAGGPRWLRVNNVVTPLPLERVQLAGPVRMTTNMANARPLGTAGDGMIRPVTVFPVPLKIRTNGPALLA